YHPKLAMLEGNWMDGRDYTLMYSESCDVTAYDDMGWNGWKTCGPWAIDQPHFVSPDKDDRTWGPVFLWALNPKDRVLINMSVPDQSPIDCREAVPGRYTSGTCDGRNGKLR